MTKRFLAITGLLQQLVNQRNAGFECVADIGCDHGKLSKYIIDYKISNKVIAVDISPDAIKKTEHLITKHSLENKIRAVCGNGLTAVRDSGCEIAVIAGLGGQEIFSILSNPFSAGAIKEFILMPHSKSPALRSLLNASGFKILCDYKVYDGGFFYDIIHITTGQQELSSLQLEFGLTDLSDLQNLSADFIRFFDKKYKEVVNIAKKEANFTQEFRLKLQNFKALASAIEAACIEK